MNLTVLGKYGPYETAWGGAASSYLVREDDTALLLDMGPGTLGRVQREIDVRRLTAIYLSHLHFDHTSDLLTFRYLLEDLNRRVRIYAPLEDTEWCKILLTHELFDVVDTNLTQQFSVGGFDCSLYLMNHPVTNYGIKIKGREGTLAYTGDSKYTDTVFALLAGADLAIGDFSKPVGFDGFHMAVDVAEEVAKKAGVKLLASHISPDSDPTEYFRNNPLISVAEEGRTYLIKK